MPFDVGIFFAALGITTLEVVETAAVALTLHATSGRAAVFGYAALGTLAISFWPYMIPFSITIAEAAAPRSSLDFMFWGAGLFVFPLMLLYTATGYRVFKGKVQPGADHY